MSNEIFTVDDNNNAAIRTVSVKAGAVESNQPDIFTQDENGNAAVRVVGGGDQSNLGYFTTPEALSEAYPTAEAGNWAIVGSTDTVWIWDADSGDSGAWVDSDTKGQVTSVNNQTGAVTLGINDVAPTQTDKSGYVLGTDGFVAGWVKPEIVQRSALPQASEEEVDKIYQYIGTTDANYTNGYFYKCVSDGQVPATYSWTQVDVQPAPEALPDQTGQSGKFLTTNGSAASWATINALQNTATGNNSLTILGTASSRSGTTNIGVGSKTLSDYAVALGRGASASVGCVAIGNVSVASNYSTAIGSSTGISYAYNHGVAIGYNTAIAANYAIQLGTDATRESGGYSTVNSDANTFKVANANGNFEMMSADGTIPTARLTKVNTTVTLAAADWSSNSQTVTVNGVSSSSVVLVAPAVASQSDYTSAGIICSAQGSGTLTFTCDTTPTNDITVNVVAL